jgi:hypothetical protein
VLPGVLLFKERDPDFLARVEEIQDAWIAGAGPALKRM